MLRGMFEKTGQAVYLSHLDLMRLLQRAFQRAGLNLTHSQGFNPRPVVSIALPMSLGMESRCELLDFQLEGQVPAMEEICRRLNDSLVSGIRFLWVAQAQQKLKELTYLDCLVTLEYDKGLPPEGREAIAALFARPSLPVEKKGKNGPSRQDIIPMVKSLAIEAVSPQELALRARVTCREPSLNPMQLAAAVEGYLPQWKPDYVRCCRLGVYNSREEAFR